MKKLFTDLRGKTVLITGASSGLGQEIAYEASKKRARVILCARREDDLINTLATCESYSKQKGAYYPLDISDYDQVEDVSEKILTEFREIDVLVNCAGFGMFQLFLDSSFEETEKMFSVNVLGLIYLTQKIGLQMAKQHHGHIVNIASQAGKMATPKSSIYAATKFAVIGFSNALRLEMKPLGVSVTTVNPGPIKTPFFDIADPSGSYVESIGSLAIEPQKLAKKIVKSFGTYKREINSPMLMEVANKGYQLFPHLGDYLATNVFDKK
ncbi:MAG: SDR family oxidoreductase [Vagococcus sp.]|uniref:SDR family NAD(P)-dependent oxidoreductase n=1 Tax=Vagococcus TaxID=2737 RepID=UPI002FCB255C